MRKSVIIPVALHTFAAVATLLWLLWYFIPILGDNYPVRIATITLACL
ncbi:hypothetical protein [Enterobacter asburiae]|nr:hypothetical protein [Enterobacter asburiae]